MSLKNKKKTGLDNINFNYFNEQDTFIVFHNHPNQNDSIDMVLDQGDFTIVEFGEDDLTFLKTIFQMKR